MPLNFFAPHAEYMAVDDDHHVEFKNMVKAFHNARIAVVLDVVYNHTCEGDHLGPIYSLKGFDPSAITCCPPIQPTRTLTTLGLVTR